MGRDGSPGYAAFARGLGLDGVVVDKPDDIGSAWDRALRADRPTVLDVHTSADIAPIPPHATWEQMSSLAEALASGDPDRWEIIKQGVKTKAQELLNR